MKQIPVTTKFYCFCERSSISQKCVFLDLVHQQISYEYVNMIVARENFWQTDSLFYIVFAPIKLLYVLQFFLIFKIFKPFQRLFVKLSIVLPNFRYSQIFGKFRPVCSIYGDNLLMLYSFSACFFLNSSCF